MKIYKIRNPHVNENLIQNRMIKIRCYILQNIAVETCGFSRHGGIDYPTIENQNY
jgi:hypothetical protein